MANYIFNENVKLFPLNKNILSKTPRAFGEFQFSEGESTGPKSRYHFYIPPHALIGIKLHQELRIADLEPKTHLRKIKENERQGSLSHTQVINMQNVCTREYLHLFKYFVKNSVFIIN